MARLKLTMICVILCCYFYVGSMIFSELKVIIIIIIIIITITIITIIIIIFIIIIFRKLQRHSDCQLILVH